MLAVACRDCCMSASVGDWHHITVATIKLVLGVKDHVLAERRAFLGANVPILCDGHTSTSLNSLVGSTPRFGNTSRASGAFCVDGNIS